MIINNNEDKLIKLRTTYNKLNELKNKNFKFHDMEEEYNEINNIKEKIKDLISYLEQPI